MHLLSVLHNPTLPLELKTQRGGVCVCVGGGVTIFSRGPQQQGGQAAPPPLPGRTTTPPSHEEEAQGYWRWCSWLQSTLQRLLLSDRILSEAQLNAFIFLKNDSMPYI